MRETACSLDESGTSAVEFALVLPVFLLILFGIMEFGWLMTQEMLLTHAVSEGAREAIGEPDAGHRIQVARNKVRNLFALAETLGGTHMTDSDIDVSFSGAPKRVTVTVAALAYTPLVGFIPDSLLPDSLHATATFTYPR